MMLYSIFGTLLLVTCCQKCHAFLLQPPSLLHLWSSHVEVSARTLRVHAGHPLSVSCDGATSGFWAQTSLSWYGPDRDIIAYEGQHNRVSIERAQSSRFQQVHFRPVRGSDTGRYVCRGRFGVGLGAQVDHRYFNLIVIQSEPVPTQPEVQRTTTTTGRPTTTSVPDLTTPSSINIVQTTGALGNCTSPKFRCDGICFDARYRCDRFPDCNDRSDEEGCDFATCSEGLISCADGSDCIHRDLVCNSVNDCTDASDERACP